MVILGLTLTLIKKTVFSMLGGPEISSTSTRLQSVGGRLELLPRAAAAGVPGASHLAREPHPSTGRSHGQRGS